ncbi:MAG TPA: phosphoribosylanthranilate isomerase [Gemmatimonadales bacterium]|nr:phosphoribosylanthranilate isomerase [Gemmatimonadales bacterium]
MAVEAKICGIRRAEDAAVAVAGGASYLGVILVPGSRRTVGVQEAREIVVAAAGRPVFGVFATDAADAILNMRDATGIRGAQLHGSCSMHTAKRLRGEGMLVWRVARVADRVDAAAVADGSAAVDAVLVEPRVEGALGGTGTALDRELGRLARSALHGRKMVLAGGLRPGTVAAAVAAIGPDVVDVSSGVETVPGTKDPALIRSFLEALVGDHPSP